MAPKPRKKAKISRPHSSQRPPKPVPETATPEAVRSDDELDEDDDEGETKAETKEAGVGGRAGDSGTS